MLSRSSASASRQCSRDLLRIVPGASSARPRAGTRLMRQRQKHHAATHSPLTASQYTPRTTNTPKNGTAQWYSEQRLSSTAAPSDAPPENNDELSALIDRISENEAKMMELLEELENMENMENIEDMEEADDLDLMQLLLGNRDEHTAEAWVQKVRLQFGENVPLGALDESDLQLYTSLYGEPIIIGEEISDVDFEGEEDERLFLEDEQGGWEEVEVEQDTHTQNEGEAPLVYDMETGPVEKETIAMRRTREVAEQLGGEIMLEQFENEANPDSAPRFHPLTLQGKFSTDPSTIYLPKSTLTDPISSILAEFSNKHVADTARRLFGGPGLPHSTTTAPPRAQLPQLPIPLHASQHHMGEMEANAYLAALYPGIYASVLSVLVEIRKRLGTDFIRDLMSQEGGPNVLDASGGGAGILAWRDVLRAEYELMVPDHPEGAPIPLGRSTVLTGSETLRLRASAMLEDTSFLPRLPDYVHVREKPTLDDERPAPKRKQYDVIIAPHTLLGLTEDYERKEYVENLWALLNPNGGVLVLLEKGRQKGFEAIAGAREMLLKRHIASPGSTEYTNFTESPDSVETVAKEPGMIIAPCTNHSTCPMHNPAGPSKGRRDYCHFEQRFIRPPFLQRIMGSKDRNHEDVKFSYLAVQRGADLRQTQNIIQDAAVTDTAFEGYEHVDEEADLSSSPVQSLSLPRAVYPPLKRRGHVIFDFCTPAGKIERWTVPRSFSRQAYRDARKARWGDLWALGAKTRIPRKLNLGDKHGEGKKERLARRAMGKARQAAEEGEGEFDDEALDEGELGGLEDEDGVDDGIPQIAVRKKGQNIPSWKKYNDKKKVRQAMRRQSADDL
ncbi:hypothetical protein N7510_010861 [Penicillium lagena]|uniref:uncharacterized protein n=1 Tax=Penicillium lagena TaxID=94218 RepID=UPI00254222F0|nr:uncharacterized protein N7510_010861 [Penicillium lagena]KAJ5601327.1 hypothetical protein N7510_010861 [Penicillium lagena]